MPDSTLILDPATIYAAVGIIGATVMPHNLYLHSSIVKLRAKLYLKDECNAEVPEILTPFRNDIELHSNASDDHQPILDLNIDTESLLSIEPVEATLSIDTIVLMSVTDTIVALCFAFLINCSILIVSSSNFYSEGLTQVAELEDAFYLISDHLGPFAGILFATALLLAGQSSTITGTLAGQIIMEGFLGKSFNIPPWLRRIVTRLLAIVPALLVIYAYGDTSLNQLLILSQVVLSLQLPFAVWPLVYFTMNGNVMDSRGPGYKSSLMIGMLSVLTALAVTVFNVVLLVQIYLDM